MRRIALSLIAVALVVLAWFVAFRERAPRVAPHENEHVAPATGDNELPAPVQSASPVSAQPERTIETMSTEPNRASDADGFTTIVESVDLPGGGRLVAGRVVVVDPGGNEVLDASGSFRATIWNGDSGRGHDEIAVVNGIFEIYLDVGEVLGVDELELDGRFAYLEEARQRVAVAEDRTIELRAKWSNPLRLHVVDATSHAELNDVTVVADDDWRTSRNVHPGGGKEVERLVERSSSPIELSARSNGHSIRWQRALFASAPGYAWGSLTADLKAGGEATIELVRGGELEVMLVGEGAPLGPRKKRTRLDDDSAVLRLRQPIEEAIADVETMVKEAMARLAELSDEEVTKQFPDGRRPTEAELRELIEGVHAQVKLRGLRGQMIAEVAPEENGPTTIRGLAAGLYVIALERGHHWDKPLTLGESILEIHAGQLTRVTLSIAPRPDARRVPLADTLHLASEWGCDYLDLQFEPILVPGSSSIDEFEIQLSQMRPVANRPDLYHFDAGEILPGIWLVNDYTHEFQQTIETGPDGTDQAAIVIGDPADVVLHLIDVESGKPAGADLGMSWNCKRPAESSGGGLENARWDEESQAFRFRAPAGAIEVELDVTLRGEFELLDPGEFVVHPGSNDLTIRGRRATTVALKIETGVAKRGDEALTASLFRVALVSVHDATLTVHAAWSNDNGLHFTLPAPGPYTVRFPDLPGFEPVAPFEVVARKGERVEQTVVLTRVR